MAFHLKLRHHSHHYPIPSLRLLSSSSSSPLPPPPSDESPPEDQSRPSFSSYFSDIKQRLGSPQSPPRRIPNDPPPPPSLFPPKSQTPTVPLEEIRKRLASFRRQSASNPSPTSSPPPISFQEIYKSNVQNNSPGSAPTTSFDSIRQSLRQFRNRDASISLKSLQDSIRNQAPDTGMPRPPSLIGSNGPLPQSIFGREAMERKGEEGETESKGSKAEFLKSYSYQELGEKLLRLRPGEGEKKEGFSLTELNQRLIKLRELEEREAKSRVDHFSILKESLQKIQNDKESKRASRSMCIFQLPNLYLLMLFKQTEMLLSNGYSM